MSILTEHFKAHGYLGFKTQSFDTIWLPKPLIASLFDTDAIHVCNILNISNAHVSFIEKNIMLTQWPSVFITVKHRVDLLLIKFSILKALCNPDSNTSTKIHAFLQYAHPNLDFVKHQYNLTMCMLKFTQLSISYLENLHMSPTEHQ